MKKILTTSNTYFDQGEIPHPVNQSTAEDYAYRIIDTLGEVQGNYSYTRFKEPKYQQDIQEALREQIDKAALSMQLFPDHLFAKRIDEIHEENKPQKERVSQLSDEALQEFFPDNQERAVDQPQTTDTEQNIHL